MFSVFKIGLQVVEFVGEARDKMPLEDPRGGLIAQFEFGPGAKPKNAVSIFEEWQKIQEENVQRAIADL